METKTEKRTQKLYQKIAQIADARNTCAQADIIKKTNDGELWEDRHEESLIELTNNYLPSGSGIDSGCEIDLKKSGQNKIVINSSYHAMNEHGYYDGWYDFKVTVKSHLILEIDLKITGKFGKYGDVKEYLYDIFHHALLQEIEY